MQDAERPSMHSHAERGNEKKKTTVQDKSWTPKSQYRTFFFLSVIPTTGGILPTG
ncbi:hypothetical protein THIOM_005193 [Candidatus Thiomargarita nelsonii]|uniref:Uncharacterized protein n=1 Tax=Candidatus Thiomargarita nelsonii TaxID=1003181 RepID=A0A176RTX4_9GAMM|nr:hypothetical protein THIOM_005193 [Candidatus Thiomargarita nelsonii]